jgi:hypothetical protein
VECNKKVEQVPPQNPSEKLDCSEVGPRRRISIDICSSFDARMIGTPPDTKFSDPARQPQPDSAFSRDSNQPIDVDHLAH